MPTTSVNDVELYYEWVGDGDQPVVFLHSMALASEGFRSVADRLGDEFRSLLFDFRGQGRSRIPDVDLIDTETLYEDAVGLVEALRVGPAHVVGMSMGGWIGLRLAARRPDLVRSLALIGTTAANTEDTDLTPVLGGLAQLGFAHPEIVEGTLAASYSAAALADESRREEWDRWRQRLAAVDTACALATFAGIVSRAPVEDELPSITAPTLVISPEHDIFYGREHHERLAAGVASGRLVAIASGHIAAVERPDQVAALIREHALGAV